jgi:transmembrane sensor
MHAIEDFLSDPRFIRWVMEDRPEDRAFWEGWLREHPERGPQVEEARSLLGLLRIKETGLSPAEVSDRVEAILLEARRRHKGRRVSLYRVSWWAAAAVLVVAGLVLSRRERVGTAPIGSGAIGPVSSVPGHQGPPSLPAPPDSLLEASDPGPGQKLFHLDEGSTVTLSPGAVLRYAGHPAPGAPIDVYLSGEALFNVAPHANRPFRVYTQELVTKVLGTRFRINAPHTGGEFRVTVLSGKVSVSPRAGDTATNQDGVVLTPNEELVYGRVHQAFRKMLVDTPVVVDTAVARPGFVYDNRPVIEVLEELHNAFGIDIVYDAETLKNCRISADLSDESIYRKLDLICKALDAKYEVIDGVVTIQAKTCQ